MSRRSQSSHRSRRRDAAPVPDPARTGEIALTAACDALRTGNARVARQLLGFARDIFSGTRAGMALSRERLRLEAESEAARRRANAAIWATAGGGMEAIELDRQIEEDAAAILAAREAGEPLPEPRWEESWALAGEPVPEGWKEPGCGGNDR